MHLLPVQASNTRTCASSTSKVTPPPDTRARASRDSPSLGNVPGEQRAQAVTFTLLQSKGSVVVRSRAADETSGDVVTPGGDAGALVDVAVSPVGASEVAVLPEARTVTSVVVGRV